MAPKDPKLSAKQIDAWEERNKTILRGSLLKAEREIRAGKGIPFDPMKPGGLLKRLLSFSRRRRAA